MNNEGMTYKVWRTEGVRMYPEREGIQYESEALEVAKDLLGRGFGVVIKHVREREDVRNA